MTFRLLQQTLEHFRPGNLFFISVVFFRATLNTFDCISQGVLKTFFMLTSPKVDTKQTTQSYFRGSRPEESRLSRVLLPLGA